MNDQVTFRRMLAAIGIYGVAVFAAGMFLASDRAAFGAGLLAGLVMAAAWAFDIYRSAQTAVEMEPHQAELHMKKHSVLHSVIMIAGACLAAWLSFSAGIGMILGLLGLKVSAYAQLIFYKRNSNGERRDGIE